MRQKKQKRKKRIAASLLLISLCLTQAGKAVVLPSAAAPLEEDSNTNTGVIPDTKIQEKDKIKTEVKTEAKMEEENDIKAEIENEAKNDTENKTKNLGKTEEKNETEHEKQILDTESEEREEETGERPENGGEKRKEKDRRDAEHILRIEALDEAAYTEEIWQEFFEKYPRYADAEGENLGDVYQAAFLPYYSFTLPNYPHEEPFGVWEIIKTDETGESVRCGLYAYIRVSEESEKTERIGETEEAEEVEETEEIWQKEDWGWFAFEEQDTAPYYAEFTKHALSASVVNANTLRIRLDIDVWDNQNGDTGKCLYQLGPQQEINTYSGALQTPWIEIQYKCRANKGQLTTESFNSVSTSSGDYKRRLRFQGYWDLSGKDLELFASQVQGDTLFWAAGFKEEGSYSMSHGSVYCANLADAIRAANCRHERRRYEEIKGNQNNHRVYCTECSTLLGEEAHQMKNGRCQSCTYTQYVTGTIFYDLNGRTETETYSETPGFRFSPKEFKGYRTPAAKDIPGSGGDLHFSYEPITYQIDTGEGEPINARYDDSICLPSRSKKGHTQVYYLVK